MTLTPDQIGPAPCIPALVEALTKGASGQIPQCTATCPNITTADMLGQTVNQGGRVNKGVETAAKLANVHLAPQCARRKS